MEAMMGSICSAERTLAHKSCPSTSSWSQIQAGDGDGVSGSSQVHQPTLRLSLTRRPPPGLSTCRHCSPCIIALKTKTLPVLL